MLSRLVKLQLRVNAIRNDRGATAVEYGLMVSLIAVAIIITVTALGTRLNGLFAAITGAIDITP
jgi:pilus assembly protein Flp/PilA